MMKKSVAIQTPNGKQIRIDEDQNLIEISDQHQNRIVLDQNGIVIESGKDRTLKALQNMKIEAFKIQEEAQISIEIQSQGQARIKAASNMEIGATFVRFFRDDRADHVRDRLAPACIWAAQMNRSITSKINAYELIAMQVSDLRRHRG